MPLPNNQISRVLAQSMGAAEDGLYVDLETTTKKKKTATAKKTMTKETAPKKRKAKRRIIYDAEDEDEYYVPLSPSPSSETIEFSLAGKPRPLRRHRTGKGFVFNPSSHYQKSFTEASRLCLPDDFVPLQGFLDVDISFRMTRPRNHFVAGRSEGKGIERLKEASPKLLHSGEERSDPRGVTRSEATSMHIASRWLLTTCSELTVSQGKLIWII